MTATNIRTIPRPPGTSDVFKVGDRVRNEGREHLGRAGTVTAVSLVAIGGDFVVTVDDAWSVYDRQLEKVVS